MVQHTEIGLLCFFPSVMRALGHLLLLLLVGQVQVEVAGVAEGGEVLEPGYLTGQELGPGVTADSLAHTWPASLGHPPRPDILPLQSLLVLLLDSLHWMSWSPS